MPWMTNDGERLIDETLRIIEGEFIIKPSVKVLFCTIKELSHRFMEEDLKPNYSLQIQKQIHDYIIKFIQGKYWKSTNEIWIISGRGDNIATLLHEYLHPIQKCTTHREDIVEYLTFSILKTLSIPIPYDSEKKSEWEKIHKDVGWDKIKNRLITLGDCEDF